MVDLSLFDNSWFSVQRSKPVQALWQVLGRHLLGTSVLPYAAKRFLLRCFGARIGRHVVIKPGVRVKFPWNLSVGTNSWLGEDCWIDNLVPVSIGANVCISQGAYICTGNHDWSDPTFSLVVKTINIDDGAWVGAKVVVCPGITFSECAVAAAGSVVTNSIPAFEIHAGNPAKFVRQRTLRSTASRATTLNDQFAQQVR